MKSANDRLTEPPDRTLFLGDNLAALARLPDDSVDLVATDPPYMSRADWRDDAGGFQDRWRKQHPRQQHPLIDLAAKKHGRKMARFLSAMLSVMEEIDRVRKPDSSVAWQCDPNASGWLKVLGDSVFGGKKFLGEISWKRTTTPFPRAHFFGKNIDHILWWGERKFNMDDLRVPLTPEQQDIYDRDDKDGRGRYRLTPLVVGRVGPSKRVATGAAGHLPWRDYDPGKHQASWCIPQDLPPWFTPPPNWKRLPAQDKLDALDDADLIVHPTSPGSLPRWKRYLGASRGLLRTTLWDDIGRLGRHREKVGYPTQKPLALYERILIAATNRGDFVLDPFCGSGTTLVAAEQLGRRWCGMDCSADAMATTQARFDTEVNLVNA